MSKAIFTLENGPTRRISLAARNPQTQAVVASERQLPADLASQDPAVRARAIRHLNAVSAQLLEQLLSSTSQFPDVNHQGVPTAVAFGEGDRYTADTRWRALFNVQDRTAQPGAPVFKISDTYDSVTFEKYEMGERIRVGSVRGEEVIYEGEIMAGALQYFRFWQEWQTLWNTSDGLASMNAKYARKMARLAYQVLTAAGLAVTPYDATGGSTVEKDVNTINRAITELGNAVYETETGFEGIDSEEDIEGLTLYLLYNPSTFGYRQRVNRALGARLDLANDNNSAAEVDIPVMTLPTRYVPANGWFLALAGRKNVSAIFRNLEVFDMMDPRVAGVADAKVGQGVYKHVRGDSRQVRQIATS